MPYDKGMENRDRSDEEIKKITQLASQVMLLSRDDLLIHLRFLDASLANLKQEARMGCGQIATDGQSLVYDPVEVLQLYREEPALLTRTILHSLLHCIFLHPYGYERLEGELWDLATDIAVEQVILELELPAVMLDSDGQGLGKLKVLREDVGSLSADRIYRYFRKNPPSEREKLELRGCFHRDSHSLWKPAERLEVTEEQWKQISRRIRAQLKSFSKNKGMGETLSENLDRATRDTYDYEAILQRFMVMGENITVNDDEFDYVYYTYGLRTYGNLPLVEPLEYKEEKKIREFVIALDTSASCSGPAVEGFLRKTYGLLRSSENFFRKVNIHILQCDSQVQNDTRITSDGEFETFLKEGKIVGYGATDFRPVFDYVEELRRDGEFENLKGLIYFTDGYGIYPDRTPDYDVIFAFLNEDRYRAPVPPWSMKVVLEDEELERALAEREAGKAREQEQEESAGNAPAATEEESAGNAPAATEEEA